METARATEAAAAAEASSDDEKPRHLTAAAEAAERAVRFGVEIVWAYGLYYSLVPCSCTYRPICRFWTGGRKIRDAIKPDVLPTNSAYEETKKMRDQLHGILQLKLGAVEILKAATVILLPLATSLASTLVGGVEIRS